MESKLENLLKEEKDAIKLMEIQYRLMVIRSVNTMKSQIDRVESFDEISGIIDAMQMLCSLMIPLNYDKFLMLAGGLDPYQAKAAPNGNNENYQKLLDKRYSMITAALSRIHSISDFKRIATKNLNAIANEWWSYRQIVCRL